MNRLTVKTPKVSDVWARLQFLAAGAGGVEIASLCDSVVVSGYAFTRAFLEANVCAESGSVQYPSAKSLLREDSPWKRKLN